MSVVIGALSAAALVALVGTRAPRRSRVLRQHPARRRARVSVVAAGAGALLAVAIAQPLLAAMLVAIVAAFDRRRTRRDERERDRAVAEALPDVIDLLALCTSAGQSLALAHPLVAAVVSGPVGAALQRAHLEALGGRSRADALHEALVDLGGRAPTLAHALADHLRYGTPLASTLDRLSGELRLDRRRRAEEAARRVPVRLLAPLIACVLPAFALLTVVPLLAASLRSLSL